MSGLAAVLAVTTPLIAINERSFFHFPDGQEAYRFQRIERTDNEREWPFAASSGYLICAWVTGARAVYFGEPSADAEQENFDRILLVSTDPFDLMIVNAGKADAFQPYESIEQLLLRLAPFVNLGRRLCDQPRGTSIGPAEL
ncbi:hypothetical protein FY036_20290 [Mesorhizobium microcysteis]|uniref:Uncharacterized protein n=1 Tax=Neoaquamicrobium microcysteis TaxID=2682781 RepID=A0A5D4GMZ3_9HYPH|nr:hypothetical protein [Mesorhizobium microcysteis]TYR30221.1 hypothetical protein FY036_20290 [Mesorhizobium microcysteis]